MASLYIKLRGGRAWSPAVPKARTKVIIKRAAMLREKAKGTKTLVGLRHFSILSGGRTDHSLEE